MKHNYDYNEFDGWLVEEVKNILGKNWDVSPKSVISGLSEDGKIECKLWVQDANNLADERNVYFTIDYNFDLPIRNQLRLFIGRLKLE